LSTSLHQPHVTTKLLALKKIEILSTTARLHRHCSPMLLSDADVSCARQLTNTQPFFSSPLLPVPVLRGRVNATLSAQTVNCLEFAFRGPSLPAKRLFPICILPPRPPASVYLRCCLSRVFSLEAATHRRSLGGGRYFSHRSSKL